MNQAENPSFADRGNGSRHRAWLMAGVLALLPAALVAQEHPPARPPGLQSPDTAQMVDGLPADSDPSANLKLDESAPYQGLAGPYLAARQASADAEFDTARHYYNLAIEQDPHNGLLLDNLLYTQVALGRMDEALDRARAIEEGGDQTEMTRLITHAGLARDADWPALLAALDDSSDDQSGNGIALLDGMLRAWALLGEGRASDAIARFEAMGDLRGASGMVAYNLGLAKAMVGDFEGALQLFQNDGASQHLLGVLARAEVLAQLDRRDEAIALLDSQGPAQEEPAIAKLRDRLAAGEDVPFSVMTDAKQGIAQVYLTFAGVLGNSVDPDPLALIHARLAVWVDPDAGEARLVLAQILQEARQIDMAEEQYDALSSMDDVRPFAEIARIDALSLAGRTEQALPAAEALTETYPELIQAWIARGDILRQLSRFDEAAEAYTKAIDLAPDDDARWFPLYARGISLERADRFDEAEADLRAAIAIHPDYPHMLNYLGYSLIDRGQKLDEAVEMIEKAADLQPDGYILDSLAWGYYSVGRYDEAVEPMERAATMMADDPLINDHLGDIYWKAGRRREAEIQWRRALSLIRPGNQSSDDVDPDRIRAKIDRGLDAVLEDQDAGRPLMPRNALDVEDHD